MTPAGVEQMVARGHDVRVETSAGEGSGFADQDYVQSGAVSMTSTLARTNATLPYVLEIADKGYQKAATENPEIAKGINIIGGKVTCNGVAEAFSMQCHPIADCL